MLEDDSVPDTSEDLETKISYLEGAIRLAELGGGGREGRGDIS